MTSWTKRAAREATRRWGGPSIYSSSSSSSVFPSSSSSSAGGGVGFDAGRSGALTKNVIHNISLKKKVGTMRNGYCYNSSARSHGGWNGNGNNGNSNNGGGGGQMDIRQSLRNLFREEAKARESGSKLQGGNAPKSSNSSNSGGFAADGGNASSSSSSSSSSSANALVSSGHESMHRKVIAIPLDRRPIMPGIIMPVRTFDMTLVAELEDMKRRGQAYVGAFLKKERVKESQKEDNSNNKTRSNKDNGAIAGAMKEGVSGLSVDDLEYDPATELHDIGTFAQVHNIVRSQDTDPDSKDGNGATLLLLGHRRIKKVSTDRKSPVTIVNCEHLKDEKHDPECDVLKATANEVVATIKDLLRTNPLHKETLQYFAQNFNDFQDPARLADLAASMTSADDDKLQEILETLSVPERLDASLVLLKKEVEIGKIQADIGKKVEEKISADQRKYFLNEQLKSIKKELGLEKDDKSAMIEKFTKKFASKREFAPEEAVKVVDEEIQKLSGLEPSSSEFNVTRNYLEWLTSLPWGVVSEEKLDIAHAKDILDGDHYGLKDVKERILEFIAVGKLRGTTQGKIITLVGPPGVGKTSIGQSIAKALDRKFFRFSVGGMSDVAEIKGHRRTYVGAMPGKLVQCLKSTGVSNPVVLIDEIDKIGRGFSGDPSSALLELLDPEQNGTFLDHYLDVPVDLSKVLFLCTANILDTIPGPLLDRMEVVRLSGYIADEKKEIARKYLEKEAKSKTGVKDEQATVTDQALSTLIEEYCREAGVRNLQKHLEKIYRKVAYKIAVDDEATTDEKMQESKKSYEINETDLVDYVGQAPFQSERFYEHTPPGVVTGLAWTAMGGSTLYVECAKIESSPGKGNLKVTGSLGDVMRESSQIAFTHARTLLEKKEPENTFFADASIHLHVPHGGTPKDGPSAGCTMITAMLSLALEKPIKANLAMTGEVTLTGRVLPIGGVKEKTMAARRSGIKELVFPKGNQKDYEELAEEIKEGLIVHFVESYDEIYDVAFEK
jgi:Lon-like ATP-dependent protease